MKTLFIEPGSPWENGYVESFHGKLRDELLEWGTDRHVTRGQGVDRTMEDRSTIRTRPTQCAGDPPPAPEAILPLPAGSGAPALRLPAMLPALT